MLLSFCLLMQTKSIICLSLTHSCWTVAWLAQQRNSAGGSEQPHTTVSQIFPSSGENLSPPLPRELYASCRYLYVTPINVPYLLNHQVHSFTSSCSSRMHQFVSQETASLFCSVAGLSRHSALSEDRIRQCVTSFGSLRKDTDQCL